MKLINKLKILLKEFNHIKEDNQTTKLLLGTVLSRVNNTATSIKEAEFKVFSQFGDDGIIQFLLSRVQPAIDKFVEFGVEDYEEANTRFLLMHNNWQGLVIDSSLEHIDTIRKKASFWQYDLTTLHAFITVENINELLGSNGFDGRIGLLSIDIDGNDYWVWQAITVTNADIVVIEYNSLLGCERAISVPYQANFRRENAHSSYLYFGASLPALCELAESKGYAFIGCNQAGNNAYFVKNELVGSLSVCSVREGFVAARFREARDTQGKLTFAGEDIRKKEILGLPVINTRTGLLEVI